MINQTYNLNDLRDIAIPTRPSFWPLATGGMILLVLISIVFIYISSRKYIKWHKNAYRRTGLKILNDLNAKTNNTDNYHTIIIETADIIKRVALVTYPRTQVASLTGKNWLEFLNTTYSGNEFTSAEGKLLAETAFNPKIEINHDDCVKIIALAEKWIKQHR